MRDIPTIPDATFQRLFQAGETHWERFRARRGAAYHAYVAADWPGAVAVLRRLRPQADSFLELGSGVGVITIAAALLGFEAAGVEIEPSLVDSASELADEFHADARFAAGTFIPESFQDHADRHAAESEIPTILDGPPAYESLGGDLLDFDLVYTFPWPGLEDLFFDLMRMHGRPGALLLTFGDSEGFRLWRDGGAIAIPAD